MRKIQKKIIWWIGIIGMGISVPIIITSCSPTITINSQGKPEFGEFLEWKSTSTRWNVRTWKYNYNNIPSQIQSDVNLQNILLKACIENLLINSNLLNKYNINATVTEISEVNDQLGYLTIKINLDGWVSQGQLINQSNEKIFRLLGFNRTI